LSDSELLASIREAPRPVVLIDGRSGSGKSTLAPRLSAALSAQLVRLDDIYPGWDGLQRASEHIGRFLLGAPRPRWRRWDWAADEPAEWHRIDAARPLVIEGCGALSRHNRALATFGIWVELDAVSRKQRALERDGEDYAPHWDRWAAQEAIFAEREHPLDLADVILDGRRLPTLR
jgi:uridine kinase